MSKTSGRHMKENLFIVTIIKFAKRTFEHENHGYAIALSRFKAHPLQSHVKFGTTVHDRGAIKV
jgi:hypothetical protein